MKGKIKIIFNLKIFCISSCLLGIVLMGVSIYLKVTNSEAYYWAIEILDMVGSLLVSICGISLLIESTSMTKIINETIKESNEDIISGLSQMDYLDKNNSEERNRHLLYMSYVDREDRKNISADKVDTLTSLKRTIEFLITGVYAEKDDYVTEYSVEKDEIGNKYFKKSISRKITLINKFNKKNVFSNAIYYNICDPNKKPCLEKLIINDVDFLKEKQKYGKVWETSENLDNNSNNYKNKASFNRELCQNEKHKIEYKLTHYLPIDDRNSIFSSKYLTHRFSHKIILIKAPEEGVNDMDISLFSLSKYSTLDKQDYQYQKLSETPHQVVYEIKSDEWIFPGDGYSILIK